MYTYRKIKVSCNDSPKRFYRVMYVREDLTLFQIGVVVLKALRAEFEHYYVFYDKSHRYKDESWLDDSPREPGYDLDYEKHYLKDLDLNSQDAFKLLYDTGDGWEFTIKLYKKTETLDGNDENKMKYGYVTEAKGDRIWEDYRSTFWQYLNGELADEKKLMDEDHPWNTPDGPLTLFDAEIDLDELNSEVYDASLLEHDQYY